ncbi:MAG TPA: ester cyclase [Calidithermus sp.]|nr:ester cyclase [Calidithermus sp.]
MDVPDIVTRYVDAWNRHDVEALVATFHPDGTYCDPGTKEPVGREALRAHARGLWAAFPDLAFDVLGFGQLVDGSVALEWVMRGTNTGPFRGRPPTQRAIRVPGADVIRLEHGLIRAVRGYWDSAAVPEQLGLQVLVQPETLGPYAFGMSIMRRADGRTPPGAFSITAVDARTPAEIEDIKQLSVRVSGEMAGMPGFLGWTAMVIGFRMMTVTAWAGPQHVGQLAQGTHAEAMSKFFGPDLTRGGMFGVWVPAGPVRLWARCSACGRMQRVDARPERCPCGSPPPEAGPYW